MVYWLRTLTVVAVLFALALGSSGCSDSSVPKPKADGKGGDKMMDKMGADKMGADKMGTDKMGADKMGKEKP